MAAQGVADHLGRPANLEPRRLIVGQREREIVRNGPPGLLPGIDQRGDEMMVLFGSPVAHEDDPIRAVRAAMEMQEALETINERHTARGLPPFEIGIGINTGEVVAGYIGSSQALEYTVIGDPVNTGSRLCSLAKPGQTLISEGTREKLGSSFEIRELPAEQVKGKTQPIRVFELVGRAERQ